MSIIEDIYSEIEAKMKRMETLVLIASRTTIPEVVFNYFVQKFGTKMADEYIASFANTLLHFKVNVSYLFCLLLNFNILQNMQEV